jgi:predicted transcriptional regulator
LGCVTTRQIKEVRRDQWSLATVGSLVASPSPDNTIDAGQDAMKALSLMQRTGEGRLMVTEENQLVGIVALKDMLKVLALRMDLGDAR